MDLTNAHWRTSSYSSGNGGDCVQVATLPDAIAVRDSKRPTGGHLRISRTEWHDFLITIKEQAWT
ncbi:hypothetical protein Sru01_09660 [Sphaerisporangium rufum]|uniref:DUF397 domain-containing protein n=1 Tax=Sphaerisporangium rufum TaxID=1381558 RepID=A0A919QXK4_9ACTN|nr:DUF397 domain-containing protein [Sphaerisporangium rufum]GII75984.1 hypothetical protein Sru01_09660 [Sphaerisporangium rufum]